jgi:hypothetical protein
VSIRIGEGDLNWIGGMRIFGETLKGGVHLLLCNGRLTWESMITEGNKQKKQDHFWPCIALCALYKSKSLGQRFDTLAYMPGLTQG